MNYKKFDFDMKLHDERGEIRQLSLKLRDLLLSPVENSDELIILKDVYQAKISPLKERLEKIEKERAELKKEIEKLETNLNNDITAYNREIIQATEEYVNTKKKLDEVSADLEKGELIIKDFQVFMKSNDFAEIKSKVFLDSLTKNKVNYEYEMQTTKRGDKIIRERKTLIVENPYFTSDAIMRAQNSRNCSDLFLEILRLDVMENSEILFENADTLCERISQYISFDLSRKVEDDFFTYFIEEVYPKLENETVEEKTSEEIEEGFTR